MRVLRGDILSFCRHYHGEKFHALLCDPPYELGFMGKEFDKTGISFDPATWAALAEHLHPGAFGMAFASSRGWHRLAVAIEDAGLRIHPSIFGWSFGSGFPKATRIDTQIDKAAGAEREVVGYDEDYARRNPNGKYGLGISGNDNKQIRSAVKPIEIPSTDLAKAWEGHRYGLQAMKPALEPIIVFQKPYSGKPIESIVETGAGALNIEQSRIPFHLTGQRPSGKIDSWDEEEHHSDSSVEDAANSARHTAQARKESSVQSNAAPTTNEKDATIPGGTSKADIGCCAGQSPAEQRNAPSGDSSLSIDESGKTPTDQSLLGGLFTTSIETSLTTDLKTSPSCRDPNTQPCTAPSGQTPGRWPSNFYVDGTAERLGAQSGERGDTSKGYYGRRGESRQTKPGVFGGGRSGVSNAHFDTSTAARFFFNVNRQLDESDPVLYCAKASRKERDAGLDFNQFRNAHSAYGDYAGTPEHATNMKTWSRNPHPTVKPIDLTRWLATLLLPPDVYAPRRILVPFSGSGSEMIGAHLAGWEEIIGIENEVEHVEIARARLEYWATRPKQLTLV